jgi:gliding motility-associated-like protein
MKGTLRLLAICGTVVISALIAPRAEAQCPVVITNVTSTNVTCNGASDGTICVTVSGGFPNYTYQIFNGPFFQSNISANTSFCFTGLDAGVTNYLVQVIAEDGVGGSCGNPPSQFVTITNPPAINVTVSVTDETCPDSNDGTATATVIGGVAPFSFSWLPLPGATNSVTGLDAGSYSVTVTDFNNCTATQPFTIASPPDWDGTFTPTDVTCNGGSDGEIASSGVTGATPPYTFLWNPSGLNTENISGIPAGSYTLTVTDNIGCTHDFGPTVVNEPLPITVTSVVTNVSCAGATDGAVNITVSGGTGPYTFSWDNGDLTEDITGLAVGPYTVTVTDANGCTGTHTATVNNPAPIIPNATVVDATCNAVCNGSITLAPTGGTGPYTFVWSPNVSAGATASNLCGGSYDITITDATGCSITSTQVVDDNNIDISFALTEPLCNGDCDGSITATVTGANPPFTLSWAPGGLSTNTISNLCADTYTLSVTDNIGCQTSQQAVLTEPDPVNLTFAVTDVSCNGESDGAIDLTVVGGTPPYSFSWTPNGATTEDIANLPAGTYTVDVTDANGCTAQGSSVGGNFGGGALALPDGSGVSYTTSISITGFSAGATVLAASDVQNICVNMEHSFLGDLDISLTCPGGQTVELVPFGGLGIPTFLGGADDTGNGVPGTPAQYCFNESAAFGTLLDENTAGNWVTAGNPAGNSMTPGTYTPSSSFSGFIGCPLNGTWTLTVTDNQAIDDGFIFDWSVALTTSGSFVNSATVNEPTPIVANPAVTDAACGQCNGAITMAPSGGTAPYTFLWSTGETTATLSNLCAGVYQVDVTDANGCTETFLVPVNNTTGPTGATVNATNASCFGQCDGSATVTPVGGTAPFTFNWVPGGFTTATVNNLCAGTYQVQIQDANGCINTADVVITEPAQITVAQVVTGSNCGLCDGTATLTPSGAAGPFTFGWVPNVSATATAANLCAGTYNVTVTAANGCSVPVSVVVNDIGAAVLAISSTPISCNGACDATATATLTGGTAPFSFLWNDPAAQTTATASGLCAGTFSLDVTDANGCVSTQTVTISEPAAITLSIAIVIDEQCLGNCDGLVSVVPSGGTLPFTFSWNDPASQTTSTAINLCPGAVTATVTDANGCTATATATVGAGNTITASATSTNVTCNGLCNGTATVTPANGTTPYSFVWDDSLGQTTATATNLCPGTYNVQVTDANGCTASTSVTITEPNNFTLNRTSTPATCGQCDGTGTVTVAGGGGPFSFLWSTGQTTGTVSGLCAGIYTVTVTNAAGCTNSTNVTISSTGGPTSAPVNVTDVTCFGVCDGSVTVNPLGGTAPYTYIWVSGGETTQTVSGLCAGQYQVQITDANGCSFSRNVNIDGPTEIESNQVVVPATCGQCDGSITTAPTGGTGPYTFSWSTGAITQNLSNLCAGQYTVTITDANGCTGIQTIGVGSEGGPNVTVASSNSSCSNPCTGTATLTITGSAPFTTQWSNGQSGTTASALCAGTYTATVTDANGCVTAVQAVITEPDAIVFSTATSLDNLCPGTCTGTASVVAAGGTLPLTYTWTPNIGAGPNITNLCAGTYTVTATDANGCSSTQAVTISDPLPIDVTITPTQPTCSGTCDGAATATVTGGTGPYTFLWDDPLAQTTATATGLCAGTFIVTVTDANGCTATQTIVLGQPQSVTGTVTVVNVGCNGDCNGSATVVPSGGTPGYTFLWNDPANQSTAAAINLCPGNYSVQVIDANGCIGSVNATIGEPTPIVVATTSTSSDCGVCNGTASASPSGGVVPYSLVWSTGQTTQNISGLCAGVISVEVTDANGCVSLNNVAINSIGGPTSATVNTTPESCFGECDGTASVSNPVGGTAPYTFLWVAGGQTTASVSNVCAGNYFAQIVDADGCIFNQPVTVGGPTEILANAVSTSTACGVCNGAITIAPSGGVAPYSVSWSNGSTALTLTNLCAGAYTVTITDASGCSVTQVIPVNSINGPTANIIGVDPTCSTNCDGSVSVANSGGTPPYTVIWQPGGQSGTIINNVCAGTYTAVVTDAAGCATVATATLTAPAPLALSTSFVQNVFCGGQCTGIATVVASGGNLPYTYSWTAGGGNQATANNLCAGTYTATVTDASGCTQSVTVTITQPTQLNVLVNATPASCGGTCDGSASASATGGTGPYTFVWTTPGNPTGTSVSNLCAGTYSVTGTDANGCTGTQTFTITEPLPVTVTMNATNVQCNGACDGTITAVANGGTGGPYTFAWSNPAGVTTATVSNLCPGTYSMTVTDGNGCTGTGTVTITEPPVLTASATGTDIICGGQCNGTATVIPVGGTAPYTYLWNDPLGQTTPTASNLCAGTFICTVTDANGCTTTASVTITEPPVLDVTVSVTNPSCGGVCDGTATVNISGGTGPFGILWSTLQITPSISNLCAGSYTVAVTDANGCIDNVQFTLTEPPVLTAQITATVGVLCDGACTGTSTVTAGGGTPPYTYSWNPGGQTTPTAINLCVNTYIVTVTDGIGCTATAQTVIDDSQALSATVPVVTQVTCFGACDGTATALATGGVGPYTYQWNDQLNQTGQTATNLCPGTYTVTVTDSQSPACSFQVQVTITQPALLTATATGQDVSCGDLCDGTATAFPVGGTAPYSFVWTANNQSTNPAVNLCVGNYSVTVTDANGCSAQANVSISGPPPIVSNATTQASTCSNVANGSLNLTVAGGTGAYTYSWQPGGFNTEDLTDVLSGPYTVTVTDATGCSHTANYTIAALIEINAEAGQDVTVCQYTPIVLQGNGGGTYLWSPATDLSDVNIASPISTPSDTITYYLTVTIGNCVDVDSVLVTVLPVPQVDAGADIVIPSGGSVPLNANGIVNPNWVYNWTPSDGLSDPSITNPLATPEVTTTYIVTVTDEFGCASIDSIRIEVIPGIIFPDGITPNGDGINDTWLIDNINFFPDAIVEIYNRWGQMLFQSPEGYPVPWDGKYNGNDLPVGTYYYVIHSNLFEEPYTGPLTLVR